MTKIANKLALRKSLNEYLLELKQFSGQEIDAQSLCSVEDLERIRDTALVHLQNMNKNKAIIEFSEKNSDKVKAFITSLEKANNSSVYIWTNRSSLHGLYKIDSISSLDLSFPFNVNPDGMAVFLTEDLNDKLLLDFYRDSEDQDMLEIEVQGTHWGLMNL